MDENKTDQEDVENWKVYEAMCSKTPIEVNQFNKYINM